MLFLNDYIQILIDGVPGYPPPLTLKKWKGRYYIIVKNLLQISEAQYILSWFINHTVKEYRIRLCIAYRKIKRVVDYHFDRLSYWSCQC